MITTAWSPSFRAVPFLLSSPDSKGSGLVAASLPGPSFSADEQPGGGVKPACGKQAASTNSFD
jgi:hypothetical protein